jgi:hypothetical protein
VFINSDSFTFADGGTLDDSPFLANAPISLGPNASSAVFQFLNAMIPGNQASNTYDGDFRNSRLVRR